MEYVEKMVKNYFLKNNGKSFLLGLSGGVDSVVLFHIMLSADVDFKAVYVHHGMSENADYWSDFCRDLCKINGIEYIQKNVEVERNNRQSVENEARKLRYKAYVEEIDERTLILGHHADDLVESMLMNLLNRAGVNGLSTMPAEYFNEEYGINIARPFLFEESLMKDPITKCMIEDYAEKKGIEHIFDESNKDSCYSRNFLRNDIIPLLKERFGNIAKPMAKTNIEAQTINRLNVSGSTGKLEKIEGNLYKVKVGDFDKSIIYRDFVSSSKKYGINLTYGLAKEVVDAIMGSEGDLQPFQKDFNNNAKKYRFFSHKGVMYLVKLSDLETKTKGKFIQLNRDRVKEIGMSLKKEFKKNDNLRKRLPKGLRDRSIYIVGKDSLLSIYNSGGDYFEENYVLEYFFGKN